MATNRTSGGTIGSFDSMNNRRQKMRAAAQKKSIPLLDKGLHFLISEILLTTPITPMDKMERKRNKYPAMCPLKPDQFLAQKKIVVKFPLRVPCSSAPSDSLGPGTTEALRVQTYALCHGVGLYLIQDICVIM